MKPADLDIIHTFSNSLDAPILIIDHEGQLLMANKRGQKLIPETKTTDNKTDTLLLKNTNVGIDGKEIFKLAKEKFAITLHTVPFEDKTMLLKATYVQLLDEEFAILTLVPDTNTDSDTQQFDATTNTFLANVAHEIRTPLNGIIGFAELLLRKTVTAEKLKEYAAIIYSNGNFLLHLITDMLDLSRIEAGKLNLYKTNFSLNRLLYDIQLYFLLDMKNRNKGHLFFKVQPGLNDGNDMIFADELRVKQILINLISNAIKFTSKGEISIGYTVTEVDVRQFYVKDSGIGMTEEAAKHIFERFRQANDKIASNYGGSGLGLSICKEFVALHGGNIWVESHPNRGTTFYFTIPAK